MLVIPYEPLQRVEKVAVSTIFPAYTRIIHLPPVFPHFRDGHRTDQREPLRGLRPRFLFLARVRVEYREDAAGGVKVGVLDQHLLQLANRLIAPALDGVHPLYPNPGVGHGYVDEPRDWNTPDTFTINYLIKSAGLLRRPSLPATTSRLRVSAPRDGGSSARSAVR